MSHRRGSRAFGFILAFMFDSMFGLNRVVKSAGDKALTLACIDFQSRIPTIRVEREIRTTRGSPAEHITDHGGM
jgi:hypothetical protein